MNFPLFFNTRNFKCLVVGGGSVASRKVEMLVDAGCEVSVIAPSVIGEIKDLVETTAVRWDRRGYVDGDCSGFNLVVAATGNREVNKAVSLEARELNIPVNVVDDPEFCTVTFCAFHRDGPLAIAVSTDGQAPFMAAEIRNRLIKLSPSWGQWVKTAGIFRGIVRTEVEDRRERTELYRKFARCFDSGYGSAPLRGGLPEWIAWMEESERNIND